MEQLKGIYLSWRMDLGVQRSMNTEEAKYLESRFIQTVMTYFSDLTFAELRVAVELLSLGELDQHLPKRKGEPDRDHYQVISQDFVMRILSAYRERARALSKKTNLLLLPAPKEPTEQEIAEDLYQFRLSIAEEVRTKGRDAFPKIIYQFHYDWLNACGLVNTFIDEGNRECNPLKIADIILTDTFSDMTRKVNELFDTHENSFIAEQIINHANKNRHAE